MKRLISLAFLLAACANEQTTTLTAPPASTPDPQATASVPATPPPAGSPSPSSTRDVASFPPLDQAGNDPGFAAYREKLRAAVRSKDWAAMQKLIDPNIRTSFGGTGGTADFRERLDNKGMWQELDTILAMGGTFRELDRGEQQFCAPYVFSAWPEDKDAFESVAVIRQGARLKQKPDAAAPTITSLEYEIVTIGPDDLMRQGQADPQWRQVTTGDGVTGFVLADEVRSSIDYRACFSKRSGEWKMDLLVAGD